MNLKHIFPILEWLPNYKKDWLRGDISAGLTVGVMLIPQGIAYAMIAGLPPIYGLYTAMIPQIVYAIFGTSRQLSVGPVAMDSLIVASGVATLAKIGTDHFIEFAILLAFIMGVLQVLFGVFKLGFLVNFLSRPVISGFTSAAALIIGLNQLKNLSGINIQRNNKIQNLLFDAYEHINEIEWKTLIIGVISILILVFFKRLTKKIPAALVVVVLGIVSVLVFDLNKIGVEIVGDIPKGLPGFKIPEFEIKTLVDLFPIALTLAFIAFLEAISVAKAIETKHTDYKVLPNKELIAIGMGNIVGSFFQTYPATGGLSRTAVNDQIGAKTPMAAIISGLIVGLTLLFLTPVFYYLPKAVLAAIIIVAVFGLLDFKVPKQLLRYSKSELVILNITLLITATIGIKEGIFTGIVLSVAMLIYQSTKPHIAILGKVPDTHFYRNVKRFEGLLQVKDEILIVRFDAQLYFANISFFKDKLEEFVINKGGRLKLIIIDGESINSIDSSGIYMLNEIISKYKSVGIDIAFTGMKGPVRDVLEKSGIMKKISYENCFMSIQEAVDSFEYNLTNKEIERKYFEYIKQTNK
ncbi:SulP family inorganic anion transporter [Lutibacter sp. B1]|uniref:SulP family inorganic anion transporter n=1 Tax=Lutibacter sp. B1 TaxID=2725996 RepID=UPI001456B537|nr:solute carrier family 26 protein [Lutibacter sp. B1]NLP57461.1 solute carrier 26 family protein [Lutibacter sp. B1]